MWQGEGFQLCLIPVASLVPLHRQGCGGGHPWQACHLSLKQFLAVGMLVNQPAVFIHFTKQLVDFLFL